MDALDETSEVGPDEAERISAGLTVHDVFDICSEHWTRQHAILHRLSVQAHANAAAGRPDFVCASLASSSRMPALVGELLSAELWLERVLPRMGPALARAPSLVRPSLVVYHEALLANALELFLDSPEACAALGEAAVDLAAFCSRQLASLLAPDAAVAPKELRKACEDAHFAVCMACLGILRGLTDVPKRLPLGFAAQVVDAGDVLPLLAEIVVRRPWMRPGQRWTEGRWVALPKDDDDDDSYGTLEKHEAQLWLTLSNLMCDPEFRAKSRWTAQRKETVLRMRAAVTQEKADQLPVLNDIRRALDELAMFDAPPATTVPAHALVECTPQMREALIRSAEARGWDKIAEEQIAQLSNAPGVSDVAEALASKATEEIAVRPVCTVCGLPAAKRCSRCKSEWYHSAQCQAKDWPRHKPICMAISAELAKLS